MIQTVPIVHYIAYLYIIAYGCNYGVAFPLGSEKKSASCPGRSGDPSVRIPIKSEETKPGKDFGCQTTKPVNDFGCQTSFNHSIELHNSDIFNMAGDAIHGEALTPPEHEKNVSTSALNCSKEQTFLHLITGYESEEDVEKPDEKRRSYESSFMLGAAEKRPLGCQPSSSSSQMWSCLPVPETLPVTSLDSATQDSQRLGPSHQRHIPNEGQHSVSGLSELSEGEFRAWVQKRTGITSTQTKSSSSSSVCSPAKRAGKENCPSSTSVRWRDSGYGGSPLKNGSRPPTPSSPAAKGRPWENKSQSPLKPFMEPASPPRKLNSEAGRPASKPKSWTTKSPLGPCLKGAPLPPTRKLDMETDSMAALFTQDSQGHRVIAHRPLPPQQRSCWSPLKDRTNTGGRSSSSCEGGGGEGGWRVPSDDGLDEAESESQLEAEMLFTQDSQGYLVIKH